MLLPRRALVVIAIVVGSAPLARAAELDKLLPANTDLVVSVNVRQILDSAVMKKYVLPEIELKFASDARKILEFLGLNPVKEVGSLTVAFPSNGDASQWVGIIRGDFDVARMHSTADRLLQSRKDVAAIHQHDRIRIYEDLTRKDQKAAPHFAALLDREVLVLSPSKSCILDASARHLDDQKGKVNPGLNSLIVRQDGKQSIWVAAVASESLQKSWGQQAALGAAAGKLQSLGGGVTLNDDVRLNFRIQLADAKAARDMRQQLEALKAIAVLALSVNEDLRDYAPVVVDVLNALTFSQDQGLVGVDLLIPGTLVEKGVQAGKHPASKQAAGSVR